MRALTTVTDAAVVTLPAGFYIERRRELVRKTITLGVAIFALGPVILYKSLIGAAVYLAILAAIHVFALVVFVRRVPWRDLFRHPAGLVVRVVGLVTFGGLLAAVPLEGASVWFWPALTLLWLLHVGALALLHIRHRAEVRESACPIPLPAEK